MQVPVEMSCNNAHLLELADAAVVSNYPLLSGVFPLSGMVLLCFKKYGIMPRIVHDMIIYICINNLLLWALMDRNTFMYAVVC